MTDPWAQIIEHLLYCSHYFVSLRKRNQTFFLGKDNDRKESKNFAIWPMFISSPHLPLRCKVLSSSNSSIQVTLSLL